MLIQRPIKMQRFVVSKERNQIRYLNQNKNQRMAFAQMNLTVRVFSKLVWEQITFSLVCQTVPHHARDIFGATMKFNSVENGFWHGQHFVLSQPYLQSRHIWLIEIDFDIPNDPLCSWPHVTWSFHVFILRDILWRMKLPVMIILLSRIQLGVFIQRTRHQLSNR